MSPNLNAVQAIAPSKLVLAAHGPEAVAQSLKAGTMQPAPPPGSVGTSTTAADGRHRCPAADARKALASALRSKAALSQAKQAPKQPTPTAPVDAQEENAPARTGEEGVGTHASPIEREALIARLLISSSALPPMPEPPSPAREAFTMALLALRAGIRTDGATDTPMADR